MYDQGTRVSEGTSKGFFATSGGTIGAGQSRYQGRSSTLAAQKSAPPIPIEPMIAYVGCALLMFSGIFLVDSFFGLLKWLFVTGIIFVIVVFVTALMPSKTSKEALKRWMTQWYCKTCGLVFQVDLGSSKANSGRESKAKSSSNLEQDFVSPVKRAQTNHSRTVYINRIISPVQRATELTNRDEAGIRAILKVADKDGLFEPRPIQLDLGIASRLASLKVISYDVLEDCFKIILPKGWD